MGDALLVGNDERLDVDGRLSSIYLPHRVKHLHDALRPSSGWRHFHQSLLELLKAPLSHYENTQSSWSAQTKNDSRYLKGFLRHMRDELRKWGTQLIISGYILRTNLPKKLLPQYIYEYVHSTCNAAADVLLSLPDFPTLTEEECGEWFNEMAEPMCTFESEDSEADQVAPRHMDTEYSRARRELVEALNSNLSNEVCPWDVMPNEDKIEELCLKNASIIFCTISSAGRSSVQSSGVFQSLVIDEASQLVEAETAIVTELDGLGQALLVGDHKQLPATVQSRVSPWQIPAG